MKVKRSTKVGFVEQIEVEELFGFLNFDLPIKSLPELQRLWVLYGLNGTGKTTLLNLVFHALSTEPQAGHANAIARTPFRRLSITLTNGFSITVTRKNPYEADYKMLLIGPNDSITALVSCELDDQADQTFVTGDFPQLEAIRKKLRELVPNFFFLPDDRSLRIETNRPTNQSYSSGSQRKKWLYLQKKTSARKERTGLPVAEALDFVMHQMHEWVSLEHSKRSVAGAASTNNVYVDVINRLASVAKRGPSKGGSFEEQLDRLTDLEVRYAELERYGITTGLPLAKLRKSAKGAPKTKRSAISQVIRPYIDSLDARLHALEDLHEKIDILMVELSRYLSGKIITFSLQSGFDISSTTGDPLTPNMLSSCERHLVLILITTALACRNETIFIIDEPEISLNPAWQRTLLDSLLAISDGSHIQFMLASHGTALLAEHMDHVVTLERGD